MEQLSNSSQKIGGAHPELFPFRVSYIVKRNETLFSEGQVLSNADRCGMFICERGEVEVSFEEQSYVIHRGDMYIYLASSLVRIRKIHPDTEGFLLDGNLDFLTVLANRVLNAEQILFIRYHPCLTLTEAQHKSLRHSIHAYEQFVFFYSVLFIKYLCGESFRITSLNVSNTYQRGTDPFCIKLF